MRILDVNPWRSFPPDTGGTVRVYELLRSLSRTHEVRQFVLGRTRLSAVRSRWDETVVSPTFRVHTYSSLRAEIPRRFAEWVWTSPSPLVGAAMRLSSPRRLADLLDWANVTIVEGPWQLSYCRRLRPRAQFVLTAHNIELDRFGSYLDISARFGRGERALRRIEALEGEAVAEADLTIAVSAADREELMRRYGVDGDRVVVVPNGADPRRIRPVDSETKAARKRELGLPQRCTVIFVGSSFLPNRIGLSWVTRLAAACERFTFLVVGTVARPSRDGNLVTTGLVPDVTPYLEAADLAVCPIQYGAGTKIKLFESLAAGLPTVAFAESLHGTKLQHAEHLVIVEPTEHALLSALEELAADRELAHRLAAAGRDLVVEQHDWQQSAEQLDRALRELVESGVEAPLATAHERSGPSAVQLRS